MSAAGSPTRDELIILIKATGGEIENITDTLADEVVRVDEGCAAKIRSIGAELASEIRNAALDLNIKPAH